MHLCFVQSTVAVFILIFFPEENGDDLGCFGLMVLLGRVEKWRERERERVVNLRHKSKSCLV